MYVLSFHDNCLHVLNYSACTLHMPVKYSVFKNTGRQQGLFENKKLSGAGKVYRATINYVTCTT